VETTAEVHASRVEIKLDDQDFDATGVNFGGRFHFTGIGTEGNIVRAGLNYKF